MKLSKAANHIISVATGTLWRIPNKIWESGFAKNKPGDDFHPGLVGRMRKDGITVSLIPGTSKDYRKGSCVFKTRLTPLSRRSYFLLKFSMPVLIEDLEAYPRGWNNTTMLNDRQQKDLRLQIGFCKGASVVD